MSTDRLSSFFLRFGLAAVFLWFGIDKFLHPAYWLNAWMPEEVESFAQHFAVSGTNLIFLNGIFEVLVGSSLLTRVLERFFSWLAAIFLVVVLVIFGLNEVTVRDLGLIGGLLAIALSSRRSSSF